MIQSDMFKLWGKVALQSFGGPAGQIAVIHRLVVEERKFISEERFLHALNFCMLLPGPEAQQLATYIGWLMNGQRGGVLAGGLFILPGFLSILFLSYIYVIFENSPIVYALFYGIKPAVLAIVLAALIKIAKKSLTKFSLWMIAILSFFAMAYLKVPFPVVVLSSGFLGYLIGKFDKTLNQVSDVNASLPKMGETLKTLLTWMTVWIIPIILVWLTLGNESTLHQINIFFSKMSLVTFGGAYAALSYVAQEAVQTFGWLKASEMMDGLAMAETTPGPLIQTVQFAGFMGGLRFSDISSPLLSAFLASVLTTWMTFSPCFLFVFTFAPYMEFLRGQKFLTDALKGISSAVVGVILNLSLWFTLSVISPSEGVLDTFAGGIAVVALVLQFVFKKGMFTILGVCSLLGLAKIIL